MNGFGRRTLSRRARYQPLAPLSPGPGALPGLKLWLRADNATVSAWTDLSGNGNNATQATGGNQPSLITSAKLNNQPALRFNGTTSFMNLGSAISVGGNNNPASVFAVIVNQQTTGTGSVFTGTGFRLLNIIGGKWAYYSQQSDNGVISTLAGNTAYCLIATQVGNSNVPTWTNGTLLTSTTAVLTGGGAPSTIGANSNGVSQWGQVDIAELIISGVGWDATTVARLAHYAQERYGLAFAA